METETPGVVLVRAEGRVFIGAVFVAFLSSILSSWPLYLLLLWCCAIGLLTAYLLFRMLPRAPNLLLHMKHPSRLPQGHTSPHPLSPLAVPCPVCYKVDCSRHDKAKKRSYLKPWDDLTLPQSLDNTISEFLEIILQRFVYTWHRRLAPASESIEDEMRVAIRHAAAVLLRRAKKVDLPLLITSKFLQPIAAHIHTYAKAREKLPADATVAAIEEAVLKEYGDHIHSAMRGPTGNIRYFRHLAKNLLPLLLPADMLESRMMCSLVEEIFASKVFVPAMNFTAKPDFINKLLLIAFNKNSRLEKVFGPPSREVSFLAKWASARSRRYQQRWPLDVPLPELLDPQHQLYIFMQFMKSRDDICILQIYLSLSELKQKVSGLIGEKEATGILEQVELLHDRYLVPTSRGYLQLDHTEVLKIATVLSDHTHTASERCEELKRSNVFGRLKGYIYHELLMKEYYPRFLQSLTFYEHHLGKQANKPDGAEVAKSKGARWRQKTKQLKKLSRPSPEGTSQEELESNSEAVGTEEISKLPLVPKQVQIVDAEHHMDGIRPYTIYTILTKKEVDHNNKIELVKRRYKEFVGLDVKLRQFHGDIQVQLPSKKAFRNMEKAFVETRIKELEQYLGSLITYYGVQDSQILASFLSPDSDPTLFLPESVTGKMKKAVSTSLKRDKAQHLDELLQTLLLTVESPNNQPSPQTLAEVTAQSETNNDNRQRYLEDVTEDKSSSESNRYKPWLHPSSSTSSQDSPMADIQMDCVMDLLVLVGVAAYHISPVQLTMLMFTKLLAQETVEAMAYKFVEGRIELMLTEAHILRLIHLLRDNLFFSNDPPRREEDVRERLQEAVDRLLDYPPPLLKKIIGDERFQTGTVTIVEGLQCRELNKQLFFKLLDLIVLELFPELGEAGLTNDGGD